MIREELERWEVYLDQEVATRRGLGGYSPEATTILQLCLFAREVTRDLLQKTPRPKKKKDKEEE